MYKQPVMALQIKFQNPITTSNDESEWSFVEHHFPGNYATNQQSKDAIMKTVKQQ